MCDWNNLQEQKISIISIEIIWKWEKILSPCLLTSWQTRKSDNPTTIQEFSDYMDGICASVLMLYAYHGER
jgi:hypothetical protein